MKKYEALKKAVADGKFKKHIGASRFARIFLDVEEVEMLATELKASIECDGIIDDETKKLIVDTAFEVLAEKLIADKVFDYSSKFESLDDLFGALKELADI